MKKGFSTLLIVIIIGSIALGLVLSISTSSFWAVKSGIADKDSSKARSLVNACAEVALENIRENLITSGNVYLNGNSCTYTISGNNLNVSSTVGGVIRNVKIVIATFDPLVISSWQEVSSF